MDDPADLRDRARRHPAAETLDAIKGLQAEIRRLQLGMARQSAEAVGHQATVAGLSAQCRAYRTEIARIDPTSHLLAADGRYEDGHPRIYADGIYEAAFDEKLRALQVPGDPSSYRARKAEKAA